MKVEDAVLVVQRWIFASLRNRRFWKLGELNEAIRELVEELSDRPFQIRMAGHGEHLYRRIVNAQIAAS